MHNHIQQGYRCLPKTVPPYQPAAFPTWLK
jgi:hypothetical protein